MIISINKHSFIETMRKKWDITNYSYQLVSAQCKLVIYKCTKHGMIDSTGTMQLNRGNNTNMSHSIKGHFQTEILMPSSQKIVR